MKKLLLSLTIIGLVSMTSCEKAGKAIDDTAEATADVVTDGAEAVGDGVEAVGDGVVDGAGAVADGVADGAEGLLGAAKGLLGDDFEMPKFENEKATTWANSLLQTAGSVKAAAASGDAAAKDAGVSKFVELGAELKDFAGSPDLAKATELYNKVKEAVEKM